MNIKGNQKGFTLLEILLVVAAIGILAGIVIFAINPSKQLGDTRNAQRKVDVNTILNAIHQYAIDNNGNLPGALTTEEQEICITDAASCSGLADLSELTDESKYLVSMPIDPSASSDDSTEYNIYFDDNNRVHVLAPNAENDAVIEVVR